MLTASCFKFLFSRHLVFPFPASFRSTYARCEKVHLFGGRNRKDGAGMKKGMEFLLAGMLVLSLTACGGGMSKEELLTCAEEMTPDFLQDIADGAEANETRLINEYRGKIVTNPGTVVSDIDNSGNVVLGLSTIQICFHLSTEEVEQFEVGDLIRVVGEISDIVVVSEDSIRVELEPAYLVETLGPSIFK